MAHSTLPGEQTQTSDAQQCLSLRSAVCWHQEGTDPRKADQIPRDTGQQGWAPRSNPYTCPQGCVPLLQTRPGHSHSLWREDVQCVPGY